MQQKIKTDDTYQTLEPMQYRYRKAIC